MTAGRVDAVLRVRGVVFDMDGLLLDSEALAMDALVLAAESLGYAIPVEFFHRMIGVPGDTCRSIVRGSYGEGFPVGQLFLEQEAILRRMADSGQLKLKHGALDLLDLLDATNVPYAVATSSSRERAHHHLGAVGVKDRFAYIVTRDDVTHGKPHPEPYTTAVRLLGVASEHVLAFEDSPNGIRSAHAAQLKVVQIPDILGPAPQVQDLVYLTMPTLADVLGEPSFTFESPEGRR